MNREVARTISSDLRDSKEGGSGGEEKGGSIGHLRIVHVYSPMSWSNWTSGITREPLGLACRKI